MKIVLFAVLVLLIVVGTTLGVVLSNQRTAPTTSAEKLLLLRRLMQEHGLDAYIIPSVDAHQSEYISYRDQRIRYISDFTGSSGEAYVTESAAAIWTDSRYHIQADEQVDHALWTVMKTGLAGVPTPTDWLPANTTVGIDPFLIDAQHFRTLFEQLSRRSIRLIEVRPNLVDSVWTDKPQQAFPAIVPWERRFSGQSAGEKITRLRAKMAEHGARLAVVSALDDIAWLLNLRGQDIHNNPVFFAYVAVGEHTVDLYVVDAAQRIDAPIRQHFRSESLDTIRVHDYEEFADGLRSLLSADGTNAGNVLLSKPNQAMVSAVPADRQLFVASPVNAMKTIKNAVEANGLRAAHIRDGAAVIKYLHWLDEHIDGQNVTELSGAAVLREFRSEGEHFKGLSFGAISAVGAHAAMAHYSPTPATDARITRREIYLIDSGGQYSDGTTDITRTVHFGTPTAAERDSFTRVLKGFISLSRAVFPVGASASFFDAMARRALWDAGLDYGHGTGHGIGAYLNVHEFPPGLAQRSTSDAIGLLENMFTSNEPGYYEEGAYGIRIEDVVQVVRADASKLRGSFAGRGALTFYDCTMAPIHVGLIDQDLLTGEEARWLNEYHARVRSATGPLLNDEQRRWLAAQTPNVTAAQTQCSA